MKKQTPYVDKANNSSMGVSHARRKLMTYFQFSMIAIVFVLVFGVMIFFAEYKENKNKPDYDNAELIQYELPADDTPVVVYETSMGTFKAVLYTEQAPKYCEYYTSLVESGYYNDTFVFAVQDGVYFMAGSKTSDGTDNDATDKSQYEPEKSKDLWPFYGAMAAYGNQKSFFDSTIQAGCRTLFIGSIDFDDDTREQLSSASKNKKLNNAFFDKGGVPNFSQQYTVFGQVYDGFDAYDKLMSAEVVKPSEDDKDKTADLRPKDKVNFIKVYMSTYGENKNDSFFTVSTQEDSSAAE